MSKKTENDRGIITEDSHIYLDNAEIFSGAFIAASKLRNSKSGDYGSIKDYFPYGDASYVQMIHVKTKRLVHLADQARMGVEPTHESIKDNLLDLINYASYYYEWLEGELNE